MNKRTEIIAGLLVLLIVIGVPVGSVMAKWAGIGREPGTIDVVLKQFERGGFPREIHVKQGQPVRLRLTSDDVTHGFIIGDLGLDAGVIHAGKFKILEFVPEEKGRFSYVCSIRCSPLHSKIRGYLVVE